ncbi:hypothetical protein [Massilia sp. CF038]|uniref:hypothetical protein n=1 Tax=Massilia sp. CF038 TaxID=1881045 RepID=UPI0009104C28|nr:hypothetical protein [Massilia sp. CF038]SHH26034.1 hypothetical protein SAMN05428948_3562 [Massilia sp. CF038]
MKRTLAILAPVCLIAACAVSPASTGGPLNNTVTLTPTSSTPVGNATLRYDAVNDSRCPPDVQCIQAGEISYQFTLKGAAGEESFSLTRAKPSFDATKNAGVRVALGQAAEPPRVAANAAVPAHPVTVTITKQ